MGEPISVDIQSTALVVIDLMKGIVSVPTVPHEPRIVVGNAAKLAQAFRAHRMPVFLVRVTPSADTRDRLQPPADSPAQWNFPRTPGWADIVPELGPEPADFIITKRQWGAFYGTELDLQLRRRKVGTIVLCGIATSFGVESTARFAYEFGYQQIFAEDACSARSAEEHHHTMNNVLARIGRIRSTDEIIAALK